MAIGDTVTAARFNLLQNRISSILGFGSAQNGYGQGLSGYGSSVSSAEVSNLSQSNRNTITTDTINDLYVDLLRARIHQIGLNNQEITETVKNLRIETRNVVAEETSFFVDDDGTVTTDPAGELKGFADFEALMNRIETDKFLVHSTQGIDETGILHSRVLPWNDKLLHEVKVTFRNPDHRRHFFNSGGEIRIESDLAGASGNKALDWERLLTLIGIIKFNHNNTITTNTGTAYAVGNYNLTSNYQTIFSRGGGDLFGLYGSNVYTIQAKEINDYEISFKIEFDDASLDPDIDNLVIGTLTSKVNHFRAKGSFQDANDNFLSVEVPPPVYQNLNTF